MQRVSLFMKATGGALLCAFVLWGAGSLAQNTKTAPLAKDSYLALHQLELLTAHLESKKDAKGMELLADYEHALEGQQASAAIPMNIRMTLQKLHEGRTQEVITRQEDSLISDAIALYASYQQLSPTTREKLSLQSIGYVRDYFKQYPRTNLTTVQKEGLAKAFQLLDEKSRAAK